MSQPPVNMNEESGIFSATPARDQGHGQKLLQEAGRNRKVSIRQFKHLEELFGSERPPGWYRNTGNG